MPSNIAPEPKAALAAGSLSRQMVSSQYRLRPCRFYPGELSPSSIVSNRPSLANSQLLAVCFVLIVCFWLLLFGYSIHGALPFTPIQLPLEKKLQFNAFMPQGWKYFTRDPREARMTAFTKDTHGNWVSASVGVNGTPRNLFGLRRVTRAQGIELGLITAITASVKKDQWIQCKGHWDTCVGKAATAVSISNPSPNPTLCGEIVLVKQPPIPWAWNKAKRKVTMPSECVMLNVSCSQASQN